MKANGIVIFLTLFQVFPSMAFSQSPNIHGGVKHALDEKRGVDVHRSDESFKVFGESVLKCLNGKSRDCLRDRFSIPTTMRWQFDDLGGKRKLCTPEQGPQNDIDVILKCIDDPAVNKIFRSCLEKIIASEDPAYTVEHKGAHCNLRYGEGRWVFSHIGEMP